MAARDVRFTVMGSGTSAGVPTIGCSCATCTSDDPHDSRTRTGAAVRWTDERGVERVVLIDAGPDFRVQALREGLERCDGLFITHTHTDHIFGIDELRRFNAIMEGNPPIHVYAEERAWPALHRVYQHVFDRRNNVNDSFVATLVPNRLDGPGPEGAGAPVDLWGLRFTPVRFLHGRLPVVGYRVEHADGAASGLLPLVWATDLSAVPPGSWEHLAGVRTLFIDGLRHRKHPTHLTVGQAASIAHELAPTRTLLIHIAHEVRHARDEPDLPAEDPAVRFAVDGLTLAETADSGVAGLWLRPDGTAHPWGWESGLIRPAPTA